MMWLAAVIAVAVGIAIWRLRTRSRELSWVSTLADRGFVRATDVDGRPQMDAPDGEPLSVGWSYPGGARIIMAPTLRVRVRLAKAHPRRFFARRLPHPSAPMAGGERHGEWDVVTPTPHHRDIARDLLGANLAGWLAKNRDAHVEISEDQVAIGVDDRAPASELDGAVRRARGLGRLVQQAIAASPVEIAPPAAVPVANAPRTAPSFDLVRTESEGLPWRGHMNVGGVRVPCRVEGCSLSSAVGALTHAEDLLVRRQQTLLDDAVNTLLPTYNTSWNDGSALGAAAFRTHLGIDAVHVGDPDAPSRLITVYLSTGGLFGGHLVECCLEWDGRPLGEPSLIG